MSIRIVCGPLTGQIYAVKLCKSGAVSGEKLDVSSDFMAALIAKAEMSGGSFGITGDGEKWTVTVTKENDEQTT